MNIAILGGSFDPPHLGHKKLAEKVEQLPFIDQVWLMPNFIHPFHKNLSPAKDRLNMTRLLEEENIEASDFEIEKENTSYTIDTLKALKEKFPENKFYWVISSKDLKDFKKWKDWQEIINQFGLIIFPRNGQNLEKETKEALDLEIIPENIVLLEGDNAKFLNLSSTEIRERIESNKSVEDMLSPEVRRYIINNKLYEQN